MMIDIIVANDSDTHLLDFSQLWPNGLIRGHNTYDMVISTLAADQL